MESKIIKYLLDIVTAGGTAGVVAFGLFRWLGQNWMESRFKKNLEKYKHKQNMELEHYRQEVNALFKKVTKIHEKEFEVLPIAWEKLMDTNGYIYALIASVQQYPDLSRTKEEQLAEFLSASRLNQSHRQEIIDSHDRNKTYQRLVFWYSLSDAQNSQTELHNYLAYNKIFLSADLYEKFREVDSLFISVLVSNRSPLLSTDRF